MRANADTGSAQSKGYLFERLIRSLLEKEGLEPRTGFKPKGEQIDGSFFWNGATFLIEAKWMKKQLPVSEIYAFKGKLDGKFHTTSGIFLSASGYSNDVEDALKFGKSLNIILFDGGDIDLLFTGKVTFTSMMKYKLRQAGDTGNVLVPYKIAEQASEIDDMYEVEDNDSAEYDDRENQAARLDDLLVFVEGRKDIAIARSLIDLLEQQLRVTYKIVPLAGAGNIRLLPSLVSDYRKTGKVSAVLVFLDKDMANRATHTLIDAINESFEKSSITVRSEFIFLSEKTKGLLETGSTRMEELESQPEFAQTLGFLQKSAQDNYNQEDENFLFSLEQALAEITFDAENETVYAWDGEWNMTSPIDSLEDLIESLNTEVIDAMENSMPEWWVQDNSPLGYEYEIREYLSEHYKDKIECVGWDVKDL